MQQHVTATHHSNKSLHVYWIIFVKIFVSETEFCPCNKLHKFSIIWFFTTGCGNKILFQRQTFSQKFRLQYTWMICHGNVLLQLFAGPVHKEWFVMATFCWNLSPSVFEPLVTTWHKPRKVKKWRVVERWGLYTG